MYEELITQLRADEIPFDELIRTMREAADAIEKLAKDLEQSKNYETFWNKEAEEALRRFQVAVANNPRWIPTAERLPERGGEYIVYLHPCGDGTMDDWGYPTAMYFDKGQSLWTDNDISYNAVLSAVDTETEYHITHWQPLPTPPKEEAK